MDEYRGLDNSWTLSEPLRGHLWVGHVPSTPMGGIVHKPDLKSGMETCQIEHRAVLVEFDGFEFNRGCFGYARVEKQG